MRQSTTLVAVFAAFILAGALIFADDMGGVTGPNYWHYDHGEQMLIPRAFHLNQPSYWTGNPEKMNIHFMEWGDTRVDTTVFDVINDTSAIFDNEPEEWMDIQLPLSHYQAYGDDDSNTTVHPSTVKFDEPWNGYTYWHFNTAYATATLENPCFWVSNDNENWHVFIDSTDGSPTFGDTVINPLDSAHTTGLPNIGYDGGINSDVLGYYDKRTDRLWCIWRFYSSRGILHDYEADTVIYSVEVSGITYISHGDSTVIKGMYTKDGRHWSDPQVILGLRGQWLIDSAGCSDEGTLADSIAAAGWQCVSPSIRFWGGKYRMWAYSTFCFYSTETWDTVSIHEPSLYMWTADNIEGPWDTAGYVTVDTVGGGAFPWHQDIFPAPDSSLLMVVGSQTQEASLYRSTDSGYTFDLLNAHFIDSCYKASIIFDDYYFFPGHGLYGMLGVYFSRYKDAHWRTYYTEGLIPIVYDTSGGSGGGTSDSLGADTDGDGNVDNYFYATDDAIAILKKGANITLSVSGNVLTISGPAGAGTADSIGIDTDKDGAVNSYLYSTSGAIAMIRGGTGITLTVDTDTLYIAANETDPTLTNDGDITIGRNVDENIRILFDRSSTTQYFLWDETNDAFTTNGADLYAGDIDGSSVSGNNIYANPGHIYSLQSVRLNYSGVAADANLYAYYGGSQTGTSLRFDYSSGYWGTNRGFRIGDPDDADSTGATTYTVDTLISDSLSRFFDSVTVVDTAQSLDVIAANDVRDEIRDTSAIVTHDTAQQVRSETRDTVIAVVDGTYETVSNVSKIGDDTTNFKTAYSWGDHSTAGYLLSSLLNSESELETQIGVGVTNPTELAAGVTYENLSANGDIGTGSSQVAQGDHNHDATYATISGETYSGAHDFTSASLEIPNGTNPTTGEGIIAYDTDENAIEVDDRLIPTLMYFSMTIDNPDALTKDTVMVLSVEDEWAPFGITLVDVGIKTWGATSYSVTFSEFTEPGDGGTESTIETVATSSSREAEDDGTLSDASIAAGSIIVVDLPATDIAQVQIWGTFYINPGD